MVKKTIAWKLKRIGAYIRATKAMSADKICTVADLINGKNTHVVELKPSRKLSDIQKDIRYEGSDPVVYSYDIEAPGTIFQVIYLGGKIKRDGLGRLDDCGKYLLEKKWADELTRQEWHRYTVMT